MSTIGTSSYAQHPDLAATKASTLQAEIEMRNYDLMNQDNQYLRYKHLMNSQYYNMQVNSQGF